MVGKMVNRLLRMTLFALAGLCFAIAIVSLVPLLFGNSLDEDS